MAEHVANVPEGGELVPPNPVVQPMQVPNVGYLGLDDPIARKRLTTILSILTLIVGLVVLFLGFFPELAYDVVNRAVQFVSAAIILVSGFFQLTVTRPNIPTQ